MDEFELIKKALRYNENVPCMPIVYEVDDYHGRGFALYLYKS